MLRCFALLFCGCLAFAQSPDAVLTQTLINEIRALRQDLQATNVTSQRVQIALYRLQSQTAIVNTAQQRLDAARTQLTDVQSRRVRLADQVRRIEEVVRGSADAPEKKAMESELPAARSALESLTAEETARNSVAVDAESQVRAEQARLADLQALLDRLDQTLDELAHGRK